MDTSDHTVVDLDDAARTALYTAVLAQRPIVMHLLTHAVAKGGLFATTERQARTAIEALTDRTIELLFTPSLDAKAADEIGTTIGTIAYGNADALADTHAALAALLDQLPPPAASALHGRLMLLAGRIAAGFLRSARARLIGEQERTRQAADTQRRRIEAALRASEHRLRNVLTNAPVVVFMLDRDGVVTFSEGQALQRLGSAPGEAVGQPLLELPQTPPQIVANLRRALAGETFSEVVAVGGLSFQTRYTPLYDHDDTISGLIGVALDITDRVDIENELALARRRLAVRRDEERRALARDLHDSIVQRLLGLSYLLAALERMPSDDSVTLSPETNIAHVARTVRHELIDMVVYVRRVIAELRPLALDEFGLVAALDGYIARLQREGWADLPRIDFSYEGEDEALPDKTAECCYRVAQEALRNILRHANASEVSVFLGIVTSEATVQVRDNGRGFDVPATLETFAHDEHFGLLGLWEHVTELGGTLNIKSSPGRGTTITARLPIEESYGCYDTRAVGG